MQADRIADAVRRGAGSAGRVLGFPHNLHRAHGPGSPVRSATIRMRLPAHFQAHRGSASGQTHAVFEGVFDSAYTKVGDYLVGRSATYFVASQLPLHPVVCVRANRVISFARAPAERGVGLGAYGGMVRTATQPLLTRWPASVVEGGSGLDRAGVPADVPVGGWSVRLPDTAPVRLQPGDLMTDDLNRAGIVASAELSEQGWKLLVRQATT